MKAEDVPVDLVERAFLAFDARSVPTRSPLARMRDALAAVMPEVQAQALEAQADTWDADERAENWSESEFREYLRRDAAEIRARAARNV